MPTITVGTISRWRSGSSADAITRPPTGPSASERAAMARRRSTSRRREPGEHFTKLIRNHMETPAWRALSPVAQALYPWLKFEWRGPDANNNGRIRFSVRQASEALGVALNTAARAFHDLQRCGFIVVTEEAHLGMNGAAKSPAFEITELPLPTAQRPEGRKLFKQWKPGCDFPVLRAVPHNPTGRNGKPCLKNEDGPISIFETKFAEPSQK